jgi:single-strand DNA-binding protein
MASFNRVILVGNLTRDPELRYLTSGMGVTDIGLAVNDRRKNANGEWVEETTFVDVTLWGRTAEVASEYLSKGSPVLIEGRLKLDTWETQDGQKRSKLKVVCDRMQMLGGRGQGGGSEGGAPRPSAQRDSQYSQPSPPDEAFEAPSGESAGGDEIPF